MRDEAELLICCARIRMNPEMSERMRALLQEGIDWTYLYRLALMHGMMPLLYWHLHNTCPEAVPTAPMNYLRDYFFDNAKRNLIVGGEVCRLFESLSSNGILAIPFRGPTLAASIYGNVVLRQFSDLELLVRRRDVAKATELLLSLGYRPRFHVTHAKDAGLLQYRCDHLYLYSDEGFFVKLLLRIMPRQLTHRLETARLWERFELPGLGGHEVLSLRPEELLLLLCAHGVEQFREQHPWTSDVAILTGLHGVVNWETLLEQAGAWGSMRALLLGLYLASDLLGVALPEEVLRRVQRDPAVTSLATQARQRLVLETSGPPGVLESCLFHLKARERLRDKIRHTFLAITPGHGDWEFLRLPSCLSFLYYLLRPIRVTGELFQRRVLDLAPFDPTPMEVVDRMLAMAEVGSTDVVYDVGCGDGRIVIQAAKRYGARGVGVDIDPRRIAHAKARARKEGVEHLVTFIQQDAKTVEVLEATVVTLFLSGPGNLKLRQTLQEQLRPGARIVSRNFHMADWSPERTEILVDATDLINTLYLWRIANAPTQTPCVTETPTSLGPILLTQQDE